MANQGVQQIEGRPVYPISTQSRNESDRERLVTGAVGGLMLLVGLRRGGIVGHLAAAAGGWLVREAVTGHSTLYQVLGVNTAGKLSPEPEGVAADARQFTQSITVGLPVEETYRRWRDPETFAQAMAHFATVSTNDPDRAHWSVKTPLGGSIEWDARVVEEEPNRLTRWETLPGALFPNESTVVFKEAPGGRGTEIHYTARIDPPGGAVGDRIFDLAQALPKATIMQGLHRFKALVETGEMPTIKPQPQGRLL